MFEPDGRDAQFSSSVAVMVNDTDRSSPPETEPEPPAAPAVEPEPDAPKKVEVKTLRQMLTDVDLERHSTLVGPMKVSPGIRRLVEVRVNRVLDVVADWLDLVPDQFAFDLAADVRQQIAWPERDLHTEARQLIDKARELEER